MTQELADRLIDWYEKTIKVVQGLEREFDWVQHISMRNCEYGVCSSSFLNLGINLGLDAWVSSRQTIKPGQYGYWGPIPQRATTKAQAVHRLQLRVDILKTFHETIS